ncbi:zinc finger C2HC domain-containing protein 1A isoform X2 [Lingula anatina]|uniref:Zinc finger C2HC domain-containing protein 1A isoform X2 n=1 Tax=Lingula anatina TaxID=7574 RepID=A0A1S3IN41_LINAN|nr:zinc finger C2HC domain-containing protein 1A isoform X2 [Lingula anatina]|eukprot:XP_013398954.1 zinc finger C2HC domain-containing protein 1A isoform X2 [Lingula anatina]
MAEYSDSGGGGGPNDGLSPCNICGRTFMPESLARHEKICAKNASKSRKVFVSGKQRAAGSDIPMDKIVKPGEVPSHESPASKSGKNMGGPKKSNWRAQHQEFVKNIRNARGVQRALETGAPLPPPPAPSINPDYVQCPHCSRRFNESAAERHMPFCKEQHERIGNTKKPGVAEARAKVLTRTQYKVPKPKQKSGAVAPTTRSMITPPDREGTAYASPAGKPPASRPTATRSAAAPHPPSTGRTTTGSRSTYDPDAAEARLRQQLNRGKTKDTQNKCLTNEGVTLRTGRSAKDYAEAQAYGETARVQRQRSAGSAGSTGRGGRYEQSPTFQSRSTEDRVLMNGHSPSPPTSSRPNSGRRRIMAQHADSGYSGSISDGETTKLSKYCHECGTKYPVESAKFCCECGVRRVKTTY